MYESQSHSKIFGNTFVLYASFGYRLAASFIDWLIFSGLSIVIYVVEAYDESSWVVLWLNFSNLIASWLYHAIMESGPNQGTLGKKAMGIKVVGTLGERISFGQASGRYFAKIISTFILFIGYLMMLWDKKKQTLHDKAAGTFVVTIESAIQPF